MDNYKITISLTTEDKTVTSIHSCNDSSGYQKKTSCGVGWAMGFDIADAIIGIRSYLGREDLLDIFRAIQTQADEESREWDRLTNGISEIDNEKENNERV